MVIELEPMELNGYNNNQESLIPMMDHHREWNIGRRVGITASAILRLSEIWSLKGFTVKSRIKTAEAIAWAMLLICVRTGH